MPYFDDVDNTRSTGFHGLPPYSAADNTIATTATTSIHSKNGRTRFLKGDDVTTNTLSTNKTFSTTRGGSRFGPEAQRLYNLRMSARTPALVSCDDATTTTTTTTFSNTNAFSATNTLTANTFSTTRSRGGSRIGPEAMRLYNLRQAKAAQAAPSAPRVTKPQPTEVQVDVESIQDGQWPNMDFRPETMASTGVADSRIMAWIRKMGWAWMDDEWTTPGKWMGWQWRKQSAKARCQLREIDAKRAVKAPRLSSEEAECQARHRRIEQSRAARQAKKMEEEERKHELARQQQEEDRLEDERLRLEDPDFTERMQLQMIESNRVMMMKERKYELKQAAWKTKREQGPFYDPDDDHSTIVSGIFDLASAWAGTVVRKIGQLRTWSRGSSLSEWKE